MSYLYLDHNIYIYALQNSSIQEKINMLKGAGIQCVYSPAHIEEIHTAMVGKPGEYTQTATELFLLISNFTDNLECLPSPTKIIVKSESPTECYDRVKQVDTTHRVRKDSEVKFGFDHEHYQRMVQSDKHNQSISTLSCEQIWCHPDIAQIINNFNQNIEHVIRKHNSSMDTLLCAAMGVDKSLPKSYRLEQGGFETLRNSHTELEYTIEVLFRILNQYGYQSEKTLAKTISGTHDTSHAIYATAAKWLLTTDTRFFAKCNAVYSFLKVPTKVVLCKAESIVESLDCIATDRTT